MPFPSGLSQPQLACVQGTGVSWPAPGGLQTVCLACALWGFTEHLEMGYFSQFKALISRKGSVPLEVWWGAQDLQSVQGCMCLVCHTRSCTVAHSTTTTYSQPAGSVLCLSQRHSRCLGMPMVIGGFCCPVSSADCHPTYAPGNTPSSSGLGFWGSGSPPP